LVLFDEERDWNQDINNVEESDATKRLIYVWLTRAKENLIVLWKQDNTYFKSLNNFFDQKETIDNDNLTIWKEIEIISGLEDINLWYNVLPYKQQNKNYPYIWDKIEINLNQDSFDFTNNWKIIQKSSKKFYKKIQEKFINKWFKIDGVELFQRLVYYLKDKKQEITIYLFLLHLKKE
jgi:hypothetical protein